MTMQYDIVIVGGSIAGASSALSLAPEGYRILLLDQSVFPRHKPCGEGLMPQGVRILENLGLLPEILARGGNKFRGMRYRNTRGVVAQADFPTSTTGASFGVVMSRYDLDQLLLEKVKSFPNITVREGFRVTGVVEEERAVKGVEGHPADSPTRHEWFHAPLTIGADGRNSVFHHGCGIRKTYFSRKRFGITGHLRGIKGGGSHVEVIQHPEGEIYTAPCGGGLTLVALLLEEKSMRFFKGDLPGRYHAFLKSAEGFRKKALTSELIEPILAVGPLGFAVEPIHRSGLLLIGDSAGFLDPITGEGMTLALKSVQAALPLIREAFAGAGFGEELGRRYAGERFRLIEDAFRLTRLLLKFSRYNFLADRVIGRLSRNEVLFQKLLGIVSGSHRYGDLSLGEKFSLLRG